ncbi:cupin [Rhodococcus sp. 06-1477-1B]|nr:cupin [Rhodococcus sp. 06-1477-1B]
MEIQPQKPTTLNPEAQFPGQVWLDPIATPQTDDQRTTVAKVRFAPGARTAWHHHARGQFLYVTEGIARFGSRGRGITEVHPGQTIYFAPGEEHFHASSGGSFMEHIAILEAADDPADTTVWLEQISDDDFNGTSPS